MKMTKDTELRFKILFWYIIYVTVMFWILNIVEAETWIGWIGK